MKKEITKEAIEIFLNGHDEQERIVDLEYNPKKDYIKVFYRTKDDEKKVSYEPFKPFIWAKLSVCLKMCDGNREDLKCLMRKYGIAVKELDVTNKDGVECKEMLDGYRYLFYAKRKMPYSDFINFFKETGCPIYTNEKNNNSSRDYLSVPPQEQFLISTGKRFFKGYEDYNDILKMTFDLETEGLNPKIHRIKLNGIRLNRPVTINGKTYTDFNKIFKVVGNTEEEKNKSELKVIETMFKAIQYFQPDVITAHNGENFDWNFIIERLVVLGTSIDVVSKPYFGGQSIYKSKKETILKLGGEMETFHQTVVPGVIITDSLHAVRRAQALDSNMKKADLKYVTKYSDMCKENRVYVPGKLIDKTLVDKEPHYAFNNENGDWYLYDKDCDKKFKFDGNTKRIYIPRFNELSENYVLKTGEYIVERYLFDDLWECDKVEHRYNTPNFLICKMLPVPFQKCCTMGTAGQWKALLMAWSYENGLAIPSFSAKKSFTGGLSRLLRVGFVSNVAKFDYNSLYPSIILTWGITDSKDLMEAMLAFLEHVLTQREKYKKLKKVAGKAKEKAKEEYKETPTKELERKIAELAADESFNDKKQLPLKILGNSFFGSYGAPNVFPWGSIDCAERTTCTGRQALRLMIYQFNKLKYQPIVGDTDGFNFKLPENSDYRYTKENPYVSPGLSRETKKDESYTGFKADVAEFNDLYMCDKHYSDKGTNKMGLGIDEIVSATINFSRKNYADYFPDEAYPKDVKMVGNTIKSKKMPKYIEEFLDKGVRLLLQNNGKAFLDEYYAYISKIYNYNISLKDIASKGKVKKSLEEYQEDCKKVTKGGNFKSRQAWMELALRDNVKVDLGETLYYINTGAKKGDSDVKRITHFYKIDGLFNERLEVTKTIDKEWKAHKKLHTDVNDSEFYLNVIDYVKDKHPEVSYEDEIILNCILIPKEIAESDGEYFDENIEYNVQKYIEQFNKRISPLLVCFSKDIRDKIIITNPNQRKYFTEEETKLCSGQPNKDTDQDTYEQLMTMEDKEIVFWMKHPEWKIPYLEECGMDWEKIKADYLERKENERKLGIDEIRKEFDEALNSLKYEDFKDIEDGEIPSKLEKFGDFDPESCNLYCKKYKDVVLCSIYDLFDLRDYLSDEKELAFYEKEY